MPSFSLVRCSGVGKPGWLIVAALFTACAPATPSPEDRAGIISPLTTSSTGRMVINPQFDDTGRFEEGLARVRVGAEKTGKWGFIDKTGKYVVNPQFEDADAFSEGLAAVRIGDDETGKWGFISRE